VEAEGGKVRAVPVERVVTEGGTVVSRLTYWYAPGRGQVRLEGNTGTEDYTKVRKSFSAAKHQGCGRTTLRHQPAADFVRDE
jgi:hypothetical protein